MASVVMASVVVASVVVASVIGQLVTATAMIVIFVIKTLWDLLSLNFKGSRLCFKYHLIFKF